MNSVCFVHIPFCIHGKAYIYRSNNFITPWLYALYYVYYSRFHHPFEYLVSLQCCQDTCNSSVIRLPGTSAAMARPRSAASRSLQRPLMELLPNQGPLQSCCPSTLGETPTQQLAAFWPLLRTSWIDLAAPCGRFSFSSLSPRSIILSLLHDLLLDGETVEDSTPFSAQN